MKKIFNQLMKDFLFYFLKLQLPFSKIVMTANGSQDEEVFQTIKILKMRTRRGSCCAVCRVRLQQSSTQMCSGGWGLRVQVSRYAQISIT